MELYRTKNLTFNVKDIDTAGRRVQVALSKFDNVDSDGDVIQRGAFAKSIAERGANATTNRKIKFLRYHDFEHEIGVWKSLEESHEYLLGVGDLGRSTKGNDAFLDYQDGIITEHSIGFNIIPERTEVTEDGITVLKELFLWEGSAVTFGANSETPVFSVSKDVGTVDYLDRINKKMEGLITALKNGKGTDERLITIEMNLRVLKAKYNQIIQSLIKEEPDTTTPPQEPIITVDNHKDFLLNQINKLK